MTPTSRYARITEAIARWNARPMDRDLSGLVLATALIAAAAIVLLAYIAGRIIR